MAILGLHHVQLACSGAQRAVDHYAGVLGLRLVLQTVSPDPPHRYHLYFGNERGEPGSIVSVVERPDSPPGREGVGGTHHSALLVETRDSLLRWKRRLTDCGITVNGPLDRHYFESIYHRDADGTVIEIATRGAGWTRDEAPDRIGTEHRPPPPEMLKGNQERERIRAETWPEPVPTIGPEMRFQRLHHISAIGEDIERIHAFLGQGLGLRLVKRTSNFDMPDSYHWYWGVGDGAPGTLVTYFERPGWAPVRMGPGQIEHYALAVEDAESLQAVRARLVDTGHPVSEIRARPHSQSFVTRDPDGQTVEIATIGPGFTDGGPTDRFDGKLWLPPELESDRARIAGELTPLTIPAEERS